MPTIPIMTDPYLDCQSEERGKLEKIVRSSPILSTVLERWSSISLPDCWLSGSVIAQTAWNYSLNLPCHHGLADIDLIYFDAFSPEKQPELWGKEIFNKLFSNTAPFGKFVTYCSKGSVRRALQASGYSTERLPGPPGKREILRASKFLQSI